MKQESSSAQLRNQLAEIFQAALARVEGDQAVAAWLENHPPSGEVDLIAVGKAAQSMANGAAHILGQRIRRGLVISKTGHLDPAVCRQRQWEAIEAAHPVPDSNSLYAGERLLAFLEEPNERPLLFLVSGGASSLVEAPVTGVDLEFIARTNRWLLASGLDILQINLIRKGLSRIKGGGLLSHLGQRQVYALAISDVPGDRPAAIGSGLLVPEPGLAEQLAAMALPDWLGEKLQAGLAQRQLSSQPAPDFHIVANLRLAREAAEQKALALGFQVHRHDRFIDGEAAATGRELATELMQGPDGVSIWGGETTVELPEQPGRGGRNQHLALAAATELAGSDSCYLLSAGTDGTDGPTDDAGALVDGGSLQRGSQEGFDAVDSLTAADAGSLLEASGDLITTGPTGTNVMDLIIGLKAT